MTIIGRYLRKIKALIERLLPKTENAAKIAVTVVDTLYDAASSQWMSFAVALSKTTVDDKLLPVVNKALLKVLTGLKLFNELSGLPLEEVALKVSKILREMDTNDRNGERLKIAVALALELAADGSFTWADAVKVVQEIKDPS